jgi:hypothetical protein
MPMNCPRCDEELTGDEIRKLWTSFVGSQQTPHAGPGRPRSVKRCPCGAMSKDRAKQRNHLCTAKKE